MTSIGPDFPLRKGRVLPPIDLSGLPEGDMKSGLSAKLGKFGKHEIMRRALSNLPKKVKRVRLVWAPDDTTWSSRTVEGEVIVFVTPRLIPSKKNPAKILLHEIIHQTFVLKAWEKRQVKRWKRENVTRFNALLDEFDRRIRIVEFIIAYGFSEQVCLYWENLFAKVVGEETDAKTTFDEASGAMTRRIKDLLAKGVKIRIDH